MLQEWVVPPVHWKSGEGARAALEDLLLCFDSLLKSFVGIAALIVLGDTFSQLTEGSPGFYSRYTLSSTMIDPERDTIVHVRAGRPCGGPREKVPSTSQGERH